MGLHARLLAGARAGLAAFDRWGVPDSVKIGGAVVLTLGLGVLQVTKGKSKGQALSQEKPDVLAHGKGPRSLTEEKAALAAGGGAPAAAAAGR